MFCNTSKNLLHIMLIDVITDQLPTMIDESNPK